MKWTYQDMNKEDLKWLCDWIGCQFVEHKSYPRPDVDPDFRRKWEKWNEEQHKKMERILNGEML